MTAPTAEPPAERAPRTTGSAAVDEHAAPEPPKLRRRPMLIAASVLLTALGALLGAWLLTGLSGTNSYIAVSRDIVRGDVIEEKDLVRTQLRTDAAVSPLLWDEAQQVVGKHAGVDIARGSFVTADSVELEIIPVQGQAVVGLALVPGQSVTDDLRRGDPVTAIIVPVGAEETTPSGAKDGILGIVSFVKMSQDGTTKLIDVEVQAGEAAELSAAAARQEVALFLRSAQDAAEDAQADEKADDEADDESNKDTPPEPSPTGGKSSKGSPSN